MTETSLPAARNGHTNAGTGPLPPSADGTPPAGKDPTTGRFLPGNKLGRGNPHYRKLAGNRTAFLQAVSVEEIRQLAAKLLRKALAGNLDAARLLLAYAVGRPAEAVNPDRADLDEFRLLCESPKLIEDENSGNRVAPALAAELILERMATNREQYVRLVEMEAQAIRQRIAELKQQQRERFGWRFEDVIDDDVRELGDDLVAEEEEEEGRSAARAASPDPPAPDPGEGFRQLG